MLHHFYQPFTTPASSTPRDRYLHALADARAAEAQYLASEALRREEEVLRLRLHRLEVLKEQEALSNAYPNTYHHNGFPASGDEQLLYFTPRGHIVPSAPEHPPYGYNHNYAHTRIPREYQQYAPSLRGRAPVDSHCRRSPVINTSSKVQHTSVDDVLAKLFATLPSLHRVVATDPNTSVKAPKLNACVPLRALPERAQHPSHIQGPSPNDVQYIIELLLGKESAELTRSSAPAPAVVYPKASIPINSPKEAEVKAAPSTSATNELSLKDKLEARLDNEHATEIRDTIQAILASLMDVAPHIIPQSSSWNNQPTTSGSPKGKEREIPKTSRSAAEATSKDVLDSVNHVHNIEAALRVLQSDFVFPSQLDFVSTQPADNSSTNAISLLAYTSRNHPVRFYEQALNALLVQLDSVESFGNDEVRSQRKDAVEKVEIALQSLDQEVMGRWISKRAKDTKTPEQADSSAVSSIVGTQGKVPEADHPQPPQESSSADSEAVEHVLNDNALSQPVVVTAADGVHPGHASTSVPSSPSPAIFEGSHSDNVTESESKEELSEILSAPNQPLEHVNDATTSSVTEGSFSENETQSESKEELSQADSDIPSAINDEDAHQAFLLPTVELEGSSSSEGADTGSDWSEVDA
ncbi:hypothetical protein BDQ12DRAFT_685871 [Crucibulum laeve]|uniref:BAG domain-containing protein n=1 Tax=Crucibulum laeve TaxID=68775 RepID=A0A5C3LUA6_9AGAR|nr:hypothetical protein BDQ12DRAFT_685871 [Crucibulum laeve]